MTTPTYSDIIYFIEVANRQNITRAAERLGITQPSLSLSIKRLEDAFGTTLLVRGRTGVKLTKAGTELLRKGRLFLLNWEQLKSDISKKEKGICGNYIIGCHPSVAFFTLSSFLPEIMQTYPELEVTLIHDLSRHITERVISFEIDFGIVANPIKHPDLVIKDLFTDEVSFWTSSTPSSTQEFNSKTAVLVCDLNLIQVQKLLDNLKKRNQVFKRIVHSSDLEVIADLTASGLGIGILPNRVATKIASYNLKILDKTLPIYKDKICLIYRADIQTTQSSAMIIEIIKKRLLRLNQ